MLPFLEACVATKITNVDENLRLYVPFLKILTEIINPQRRPRVAMQRTSLSAVLLFLCITCR